MCLVAQWGPTPCDSVDCSPPGSSVHGIPRQENWSELPFPSLGDLPNPGMELKSLASPALAGGFFTTSATWEAPILFLALYFWATVTDVPDQFSERACTLPSHH